MYWPVLTYIISVPKILKHRISHKVGILSDMATYCVLVYFTGRYICKTEYKVKSDNTSGWLKQSRTLQVLTVCQVYVRQVTTYPSHYKANMSKRERLSRRGWPIQWQIILSKFSRFWMQCWILLTFYQRSMVK